MICRCGHLETVHHLTPAKVRTWCSRMDAAGQCPCELYEAGGSE